MNMESANDYCPLVSILIPVFNRQNTIENCIRSALSQNYDNFEVIISDNNSDDETWIICKQYKALDSRVRIFRNHTNIGPVNNWKKCAEEAKGKFVKVLFSDDILLPHCLKDMVKAFDSRVALVYSAALVGKSLEKSKVRYSNLSNELITRADFINRVICGDAPVSPGAILYRTNEFIDNLHTTFPTVIDRPYALHGAGPDVLVSFITSLKYDFVAHCNWPRVFFKLHVGSITIGPQSKYVEQGYMSAISWFLKKNFGLNTWRRYLALQFLKKILKLKFITPGILLKENEGTESFYEIFLLLFTSARLIIDKVFKNSIEIIIKIKQS